MALGFCVNKVVVAAQAENPSLYGQETEVMYANMMRPSGTSGLTAASHQPIIINNIGQMNASETMQVWLYGYIHSYICICEICHMTVPMAPNHTVIRVFTMYFGTRRHVEVWYI